MKDYSFKSGIQLSSRSILTWRIIQFAVWLVGATILICLVFFPSIGIHMFWNILIPVAPALLVVFTGVWRNVCPMATTSLLPRHFGVSKRRRLSTSQIAKLNLAAIIALYVLMPLRHAFFNTNGWATAALIGSMVVVSVLFGFMFEWKSAWCSGLCPVHPVEKLYGTKSMLAVPNALCCECRNCVVPCPDSTPGVHPMSSNRNIYQKISGLLLVGGFPGIVWGWFHVPDHTAISTVGQLAEVYRFPLLGLAATLILFLIARKVINKSYESTLIAVFAASAVACYYWYRIPALFGFGLFHGDGKLVDLTSTLAPWFMTVSVVGSAAFFFYWIVFRKGNNNSWLVRPAYATGEKKI